MPQSDNNFYRCVFMTVLIIILLVIDVTRCHHTIIKITSGNHTDE